jgi:hypothetical protein
MSVVPATESEIEVVHVDQGTIGAITRSEIESQLDAAHKYRRSIKRFLDDATTLVTFSQDIAASCIYSLPRGRDESGNKKVITGPSVRLAEMVLSAYGNMHVGARVIGAEEKEVVSQGVAWDLEKNIRVTIEKRRRITDSKGRRYNDDMITVTGNAAASIALRDAIFRVIPRAYVNAVYEAARKVAVGDATTLQEKRTKMLDGFMKLGVQKERVLARLERAGVEDISLTDIETLIGFANSIKDGSTTIDDAFPQPEKIDAAQGKSAIDRIVEEKKAKPAAEATETVKEAGKSPEEAHASQQAQKPADPEATCTETHFNQIEIAAKGAKLQMGAVHTFVKGALGYKLYSQLKQRDFEKVTTFIAKGGKE